MQNTDRQAPAIDLDTARQKLGLRSLTELGRMLGYGGAQVRTQMHKIKSGSRPLGEPQKRLLQAYLDGYRPPDWPTDQGSPAT